MWLEAFALLVTTAVMICQQAAGADVVFDWTLTFGRRAESRFELPESKVRSCGIRTEY